MSSEMTTWRSCSTCKKTIAFQQTYYLCSVSTCNRKRNGFFFCSVLCWDAHVPTMRHREAWAEQYTAPTRTAWEREQQAEQHGADASAQAAPKAARQTAAGASSPEVLIVVSKLKQYIKQQSGMNTSDSVTSVLSDHLRRLCHQAIHNAAEDGRKTVMDRDFLPVVDPQGVLSAGAEDRTR